MELDGHPTQDMIEEFERRGAVRLAGTSAGPRVDGLRFLNERMADAPGFWLFLPLDAFDTGFDDTPAG